MQMFVERLVAEVGDHWRQRLCAGIVLRLDNRFHFLTAMAEFGEILDLITATLLRRNPLLRMIARPQPFSAKKRDPRVNTRIVSGLPFIDGSANDGVGADEPLESVDAKLKKSLAIAAVHRIIVLRYEVRGLTLIVFNLPNRCAKD
jgi:hypothetical protein